MALENQINLYSVDTGNFYTKKERVLHNKNATIRKERREIADKLKIIKSQLIDLGYSSTDLKKVCSDKIDEVNIIEGSNELLDEYIWLNNLKRLKTQ